MKIEIIALSLSLTLNLILVAARPQRPKESAGTAGVSSDLAESRSDRPQRASATTGSGKGSVVEGPCESALAREQAEYARVERQLQQRGPLRSQFDAAAAPNSALAARLTALLHSVGAKHPRLNPEVDCRDRICRVQSLQAPSQPSNWINDFREGLRGSYDRVRFSLAPARLTKDVQSGETLAQHTVYVAIPE